MSPSSREAGTTGAEERMILVRAVQMAVDMIDVKSLRPVIRREAGPAYYPETLLSLLVYCYASQTIRSSEIEDQLRLDAKFREYYKGEFPDAKMLRRFRRENRPAVQECLLAVLRILGGYGITTGISPTMTEAELAEEVLYRITRAMFLDTLELDEDSP